MKQFQLDDGQQIFLATVVLCEPVYAFGSGLGFTDCLHVYVVAQNKEAAEELAANHLNTDRIKVKYVQGRLAIEQNPNHYTFPEKMVGLMPVADESTEHKLLSFLAPA